MTNGGLKTTFLKESAMENANPFCTAIVEEDFPEEVHSPTDSSEDSVEVKVEAISIRNKRKCAEPRRVQEGPLKKRMCLQAQTQPFRPWSRGESVEKPKTFLDTTNSSTTIVPRQIPRDNLRQIERIVRVSDVPHAYFRPPSPIRRSSSPVQPVALVKKREAPPCDTDNLKIKVENTIHKIALHARATQEELRIPMHPQPPHFNTEDADRMLTTSAEAFPRLQQTRKEQRNYKNMTRERRIEANARERTRVHTISAAFDTLRRSIPAYSHSQKLSKLSVLRVACSYILTLSNMLEDDQTEVPQCVEQVTKTIQREGKLRKKKDDTD